MNARVHFPRVSRLRALGVAAAVAALAGCSSVPDIPRQVQVIAPPADLPERAFSGAAEPPSATVTAPTAQAPTVIALPSAQERSWEAGAAPPQPEPPRASAAVAELPRVVYFDVDAYKVDERYRPMLIAHAERLRTHPSLRLVVRAHTDGQGPGDYNEALARKRAEMVRRSLVALGAPAGQIEEAREPEPALANTSGTGQASPGDRRVELIDR